MSRFYRDYAAYLATRFPGKVQKIGINASMSCPNRDGSISRGGCIYCNNSAFSPDYHLNLTADVARQIERGKEFFARKYPTMRYLAYFQSYTNTHGDPDRLMELYAEAAAQPDVVGIIIGTRPDCMEDALLSRLAELNRTTPVMVEYGAESTHDTTLALVNRCHTWAQTVDATLRTTAAGIDVGLHFILGLPGETRQMMMQTIERINALPVSSVKFHQLQIVRGTPLERMVSEGTLTVHPFTVGEYIDLCVDIVEALRPDIAIDRFVSQTPDALLVAPRWGLKNHEFTARLEKALAARAAKRCPHRG